MEKQNSKEITFVNCLMEVTSKSNKEFMKYIGENFHPRGSNSLHKIEMNIEMIKSMNVNQQLIVKARAKEFEEDNDLSKYVTPLIALFGSMVTAYGLLTQLFVNKTLGTILLVIIAFAFCFISYKIYQTLTIQRSSAVFFNNLISNIKFEDKPMTKDIVDIKSTKTRKKKNELPNTNEVHHKTL